jgi:hypothetical protein
VFILARRALARLAGDLALPVHGAVLVVVALATSALLPACAYAPAFRPVGPPMGDRVVEAGVGVDALFGQDTGGAGTAGWVTGRVADDLFVVGRAHVSDAVPWSAEGGLLGVEHARQWGGAAGIRGLYELRPGLLAGGEVTLDYTQFSSTIDAGGNATADPTTQHFVSAIAAFPVAEEAFRDGYVYLQPAIGAGYRFGDVDVPFGGFFEVPIGFAWRPQPWLLVLGEGGVSLPFSGGYVAAGAAFRF